MTEFKITFIEDREPERVSAESRAFAFRLANRKFDATPSDIEEIEEVEDGE